MTGSRIEVDLDERERLFLSQGISQWGGPASSGPEVAALVGYADSDAMDADRARLEAALLDGDPMTRQDWRRALVATELIFASDVYGAGVEWATVSPFSDAESVAILRRVQRALVSCR